jgi:hypothetical protein
VEESLETYSKHLHRNSSRCREGGVGVGVGEKVERVWILIVGYLVVYWLMYYVRNLLFYIYCKYIL